MITLMGNPRKIFKIIYKRYNQNNSINSEELQNLFPFVEELEEDLSFLKSQELIEVDYHWNYLLTSKGRVYFKNENINSIEICIKSIVFPIIVSIITTLLTLWLKN